MADFIPDSEFVPDSPTSSPTVQPQGAGAPGFVPDDKFVSDEDKYGGLGQQAISGIEGVGEGIAGPLATAAERALGVPSEDILGRRQTNPWTHGIGQVAGLATGVGLGSGVAEVGELAAKAISSGLAKTAVNTAAELAALQSSDEISRMIMNDPNQTLQTAVVDVGLAGLLGAGGGAAFGLAGKGAKALSSKTEGFVSDFVDRLKGHFGIEAPAELPAEMPAVTPSVIPSKPPGKMPSVSEDSIFSGGADKAARQALLSKNPVSADVTSPLEPNFFSRNRVEAPSSIAEAPEPLATEGASPSGDEELRPGHKLADYLVEKGGLKKIASEGLGSSMGYLLGKASRIPGAGTIGALVGDKALTPFFENVLPVITKPLTEMVTNSQGLKAAAEYGLSVIQGAKLMKNAAAATLGTKSSDVLNGLNVSEKDTDKLDKQLAEYEQNPAGMLELGGHLEHYMPNHAASLSQTAANAVQFLNAQRPKESQALAFDTPQKPLPEQNSQWKRTLSIAQQPLHTMKLLNEGRLTHQDIQTVSTLYPSFYQSMKNELMNSVIDAKDKGIKVPYDKRTSLALFMGEPLDSTMTPESIQSIQAVYAVSGTQTQRAMAQAATAKKGSASKINQIASMSATADQAREKERQMKG